MSDELDRDTIALIVREVLKDGGVVDDDDAIDLITLASEPDSTTVLVERATTS
jgi:hypothetical protein